MALTPHELFMAFTQRMEDQMHKVDLVTNTDPSRLSGAGLAESAKLLALCAQQMAAMEQLVAERIVEEMQAFTAVADASTKQLEGLANRMAASEQHLAGRIDAFTTATDASTRKLGTWTMVMAIATGALVLTSIAQIVVSVLGHR